MYTIEITENQKQDSHTLRVYLKNAEQKPIHELEVTFEHGTHELVFQGGTTLEKVDIAVGEKDAGFARLFRQYGRSVYTSWSRLHKDVDDFLGSLPEQSTYEFTMSAYDVVNKLIEAVGPHLDWRYIEFMLGSRSFDGPLAYEYYLFLRRHPELVDILECVPSLRALVSRGRNFRELDSIVESAAAKGVPLKEAFCILWNGLSTSMHEDVGVHGTQKIEISPEELSPGLWALVRKARFDEASYAYAALSNLMENVQEKELDLDPNEVNNIYALGLERLIYITAIEGLESFLPSIFKNPLAAERAVKRYIRRNHWEDMDIYEALPSLIQEMGDTVRHLQLGEDLSFTRIAEISHEYHDELQRISLQEDIEKYSKPENNIYFPSPPIGDFFDDKYNMEYIKNALALVLEGSTMKHCVGDYVDECEEGDAFIYHIEARDGGERATMELGQDGFVEQVMGVKNKPVSEHLREWVGRIVANARLSKEAEEGEPRIKEVGAPPRFMDAIGAQNVRRQHALAAQNVLEDSVSQDSVKRAGRGV